MWKEYLKRVPLYLIRNTALLFQRELLSTSKCLEVCCCPKWAYSNYVNKVKGGIYIGVTVSICPDFVKTINFRTAWPLTSLGKVVHHLLECHVEKKCCAIFKVKVTMKVSITKIWLLLLLFWTAKPLEPNLVWWHITLSWSTLWENWVAVFRVMVITKVQNLNESLVSIFWTGDASCLIGVSGEKLGVLT